jgi:hypothetical protein
LPRPPDIPLFSPGDLLVYRVGDGSAAPGATATAVFLDEYSPLGTFVQSIPLTTTGSSALTATGNSTTEGILSLSQDGNSIIFGGYRADAGTANPSGTAGISKVIGTIGLAGLANTSVAVTDAGTAAMRSATSTDGSSLFYIGTSTGVRYVGSPSGSATTALVDSRNSRQVILNANVLYASNGSTTIAAKVQNYGTLPMGSTTANAMINLPTADAVNGFVMFDLSPSVPGIDTIYTLDTVVSQLQKWTFDGSVWNASGTLSSTAANLTGTASGGTVTLFLTTAGALQTGVDSSGFGNTINGTITTLASVAANEVFRGVASFPAVVPEPSIFSLIVLGAFGFLAFGRRKS